MQGLVGSGGVMESWGGHRGHGGSWGYGVTGGMESCGGSEGHGVTGLWGQGDNGVMGVSQRVTGVTGSQGDRGQGGIEGHKVMGGTEGHRGSWGQGV